LDVNTGNVLLHWTNENSYCGKHNLSKIKYIVYKINSKYIRVKTFGCIAKISDLGLSILRPKENIYILGQCKNPSLVHDYLSKYDYSKIENARYLFHVVQFLPPEIYLKTIMFKILNEYPYNTQSMYYSPYIDTYKDYLSSNELLLKYFNKYIIDKPNISEDTFIVDS
jgi:hypothetical protein